MTFAFCTAAESRRSTQGPQVQADSCSGTRPALLWALRAPQKVTFSSALFASMLTSCPTGLDATPVAAWVTPHFWSGCRISVLQCGRLLPRAPARPPTSPASFRSTSSPTLAKATATDVKADAPAASPARPSDRETVEQESLAVLEWPAVCRQVAAFPELRRSALQIVVLGLQLGRTQEESEELLQQTAEAGAADFSLKGVYDVEAWVRAVQDNRRLHAAQLSAILSTLQVARRVQDSTRSMAGCTALQGLAGRVGACAPPVVEAIRGCIKEGDTSLLDGASERLADIRAQRGRNAEELRDLVEDWAARMHAKGVCERPQVALRRGRQCLPVKATRVGDLPKGSMKLGTSASGATHYVEPKPVIALNNLEARLDAAESEEEERVLARLSEVVAANAASILQALEGITALDIARARARHARWLGGARPSFLPASSRDPEKASGQSSSSQGCVHIQNAFHPLLLQPSLPPLPRSPALAHEDASTPVRIAMALEKEATQHAIKTSLEEASLAGQGRKPPPQPLQLTVPAGARVAAITGPNTGGKTVALKTLGLMALMAKAGLYLPLAASHAASRPPHDDSSPQPSRATGEGAPQASPKGSQPCADRPVIESLLGTPPEGSPGGKEKNPEGSPEGRGIEPGPCLAWFDAVLADIGDSQDLQQSLSTFSGHIRRVDGILRAAGPATLVLLDEVGSGTDPTEGAALAAAVLETLADRSLLTMASTHHAELNKLAADDARFVNASMSFNTQTLRPKYQLLWGSSGKSNALAVAEGLRFDPLVLQEAAEIARGREVLRLKPGDAGNSVRAQAMQGALKEELRMARTRAEEAQQTRAAAAARHGEAEEATQKLRAQIQASKGQNAKSRLHQASREMAVTLDSILASCRRGKLPPETARQQIQAFRERSASVQEAVNALQGLRTPGEASSAPWNPRQGDAVFILSMGRSAGHVVRTSGDQITVKVGGLSATVQRKDIVPREQEASAAPKSLSRQKSAGSSQAQQQQESVAVQVPENTVDLRGMQGDEALDKIEDAMQNCPRGMALFVIHGIGTGKLKARVLDHLAKHTLVKRLEPEEKSGGGCTILHLRL